jgi:hypothetical protein
MREHLIPSIVASVIACAAALGFSQITKPIQVTHVITAPAGATSPAKAQRLAKTVWPELPQTEIDALTLKLKDKPGQVTILCLDDSKCGDLALNLENAFESAHWQTTVANSPMVPPGIISSSAELVVMLNASTGMSVKLDRENKNAGPGDYIASGARQ